MGSQTKYPETEFKVPSNQALRKSIRQLRWFKSTFEEHVEASTIRTAINFQINSQILAECFIKWVRTFEASKPSDPNHRYAYVGHSAGNMLKELIVKNPIEVVDMPKATDRDLPEYFWPEGFVYVSYCLNVRRAVLRQDFNAELEPVYQFKDIRTWWSFKENVTEMPDYAIPFLDLFMGQEPNWTSPGLFTGKVTSSQIGTFYAGQIET